MYVCIAYADIEGNEGPLCGIARGDFEQQWRQGLRKRRAGCAARPCWILR
jgi:hypothetical protein